MGRDPRWAHERRDAAELPTKQSGLNHDTGKTRMDLLPWESLEAVADVLTSAASSGKYPANNWRGGMDWSRQAASLLRHVSAFMRGEDHDPETGKLHLAHASCRALMLLSYQLTNNGTDDRYKGETK